MLSSITAHIPVINFKFYKSVEFVKTATSKKLPRKVTGSSCLEALEYRLLKEKNYMNHHQKSTVYVEKNT
jgi:hypothetical protein